MSVDVTSRTHAQTHTIHQSRTPSANRHNRGKKSRRRNYLCNQLKLRVQMASKNLLAYMLNFDSFLWCAPLTSRKEIRDGRKRLPDCIFTNKNRLFTVSNNVSSVWPYLCHKWLILNSFRCYNEIKIIWHCADLWHGSLTTVQSWNMYALEKGILRCCFTHSPSGKVKWAHI